METNNWVEGIDHILDTFATHVEVSRYGVEIGSKTIATHTIALEKYKAEAIEELLAHLAKEKREAILEELETRFNPRDDSKMSIVRYALMERIEELKERDGE